MSATETCSRCGQEVRWGWRDDIEGYWHRDAVDHIPIFGHIQTNQERAEVERQLDLPRVRMVTHSKKVDGESVSFEVEEVYTTRAADRAKLKKKARDLLDAEEASEEDDPVDPLPPVEISCHPVDPGSFAPRSGIKQVVNLVAKSGWELRRLTHARGPYVGARGECLSISDAVVLGARGPVMLDGTVPIAVGSWRDGKFDFAITGSLGGATEKVDATTLKNWIKEHAA